MMMMRRSAIGLLPPLALASAAALAMPQLVFLGYDLRGLLELSRIGPIGPPPEGIAYVIDDGAPEWQALSHRPQAARKDEFRLGYEIADLVLLITPPTLARHRL